MAYQHWRASVIEAVCDADDETRGEYWYVTVDDAERWRAWLDGHDAPQTVGGAR